MSAYANQLVRTPKPAPQWQGSTVNRETMPGIGGLESVLYDMIVLLYGTERQETGA
jgi:hypothetical protein